ncbi:MAG: hypothetical protein RLY90_787 [Pseudomonadota bacterium]|jgi:ABC-type branched-subunit amino acid transport system ATPase component
MLEVQKLHKSLGGLHVVNDVSFTVQAGEIVALIGPNGAGKSTTFNMLNGQLAPDAGDITLQGQSLLHLKPHDICRRGVGRTFQIAETFASLTVLENVQMALLAQHQKTFSFWQRATHYQSDAALALLAQVALDTQAHRPCSALAYGDIKRLELAMVLAGQPRVLLLDEPTAGMALAERRLLIGLVRRLVNQHQMAALFTEHSMDVVFDFADRVLVMARGQLIAQGTPSEVQHNPAAQAAYFGSGALL